MLENEYRALMDQVTPSPELVSGTAIKMKEMMESKRNAPRFRRGTILLAALILVGVIGASAFALTGATLMDWYGNQIMAEPHVPAVNTAIQDALMTAMSSAPDDELWVAQTGEGSWSCHYPKESFSSMDALVQRIKSSDPEFLTPTIIPEGYRFVSGLIWFYTSLNTRNAGLTLLGEEKIGEDVWMRKFRLPDCAKNDIESYNMSFQNDEGTWFHISCGREDASSHHYFPVEEGESRETISLAGMAKGIYLYDQDRNHHSLRLRKTDVQTKVYYRWPLHTGYSDMEDQACLFDSAEYTLEGALDKDQLLKIAESLQ